MHANRTLLKRHSQRHTRSADAHLLPPVGGVVVGELGQAAQAGVYVDAAMQGGHIYTLKKVACAQNRWDKGGQRTSTRRHGIMLVA
jgi:hypothetical protein